MVSEGPYLAAERKKKEVNKLAKKIVIDPITRIEGHLRIEAKVENGKVVDAWSSSTMFRGIEIILKDRDPRDAWYFTQRI
jgi:Ni,Fe-hydrogenase I large subunit